MNPAKPLEPRRSTSTPAAQAAWERRQRAAWLDYLRTVREAARTEYDEVEVAAWHQLRRRLHRNDELLAAQSR